MASLVHFMVYGVLKGGSVFFLFHLLFADLMRLLSLVFLSLVYKMIRGTAPAYIDSTYWIFTAILPSRFQTGARTLLLLAH